MQTIDVIRDAVPSQLPDLREIPLAETPSLSRVTLGAALRRVMPGPQEAAPVPVAAFQSAI